MLKSQCRNETAITICSYSDSSWGKELMWMILIKEEKLGVTALLLLVQPFLVYVDIRLL